MQFLGGRLREARLRRNMSLEQVADLLRVNRKTIAEAEQGNPRTAGEVYAGILWALGIGEQLDDLAAAEREYEELKGGEGRKRASRRPK
jgi:transcriptional regulator with XRE-family HTH domain